MSVVAAPARPMRIGDLARAAGTTTRTVRYYEEIGLLPRAGERPAGQHRVYTDADLDRLRELIRLRDLLGVSLDELRELAEAEDARAALRTEFEASEDPERRREILEESLPLIDRQLVLIRRRQRELEKLEAELAARRRRIRRRLAA
ncbi:MAG: MerR family transcriptional regulator [Actinobacteria bacterium]|nr:MerR family transcriptional regulator [Actinomycetota bacterium]